MTLGFYLGIGEDRGTFLGCPTDSKCYDGFSDFQRLQVELKLEFIFSYVSI